MTRSRRLCIKQTNPGLFDFDTTMSECVQGCELCHLGLVMYHLECRLKTSTALMQHDVHAA